MISSSFDRGLDLLVCFLVLGQDAHELVAVPPLPIHIELGWGHLPVDFHNGHDGGPVVAPVRLVPHRALVLPDHLVQGVAHLVAGLELGGGVLGELGPVLVVVLAERLVGEVERLDGRHPRVCC